MYPQFALAALLAFVGLSGPLPHASESTGTVGATITSSRLSDSLALPATGDEGATPSAGVDVEKIDIIVPPVDSATAPSVDPSPEPQSEPGEITAEQLVAPDRVESEVVDAIGFQTVGITWPTGTDVTDLGGQVRTQTDGNWTAWIDLAPGEDSPDAGTADAENAVRGGTDPVSIGDVDAVQLAFTGSPDGGPAGLSLALVGSNESLVTDRVVGAASGAVATTKPASFSTGILKTASAPRVISRAEWGAPAQVCAPDVAGKLVGAVVHHTAGSNSYNSVAEAMQQIRNDAAFHISGRGWCDIGYNFIVDKWGNIYEGRANSMTQPVIGVHAGGFNTGTVGVSMLGTYDAAPSAATQTAVGQIIGWRLGAYDLDPQGSMNYYTTGGENSRYSNQNVSLPRIFGHRDTAYTACPGDGGWNALPRIRAVAADVARTANRLNAVPFGSIDLASVSATGTTLTVAGWALDPDETSPISVHVYVDGQFGAAFLANGSRTDVGRAFNRGDLHGYYGTIPIQPGNHLVCAYAIDSDGGNHGNLPCRTVTNATPFGAIDTATVAGTTLTVAGWALDPDTTDPISVHIYIDGKFGTAVTANGSRTDVGAVFGRGDQHGYYTTLATTPGDHLVCAYAIDSAGGNHGNLPCRTVTNATPFGAIDTATVAGTTLTVAGWALDPDTTDPISVHIYIDGKFGTAVTANGSRTDVGAVFGRGDQHGYYTTLPTTPGGHLVCAYAIDSVGGNHGNIPCRTVR